MLNEDSDVVGELPLNPLLEQLRLDQELRVKALNGAAPAGEAKPASGQQ
jgi:hypothetical protein